jgi:hypothetical protein
VFTYEINEKIYEQKTLVWGQVRQLTNILKDVAFGPETSAPALINLLGDKMPLVLAVLLTESGTSVKDKNLDACAEELSFAISVDVVVKVVEDFFACNPIVSTLEKLSGVLAVLKEKIQKALQNSTKE